MTSLHELTDVEAVEVQGGAVAPLVAVLLVGSTAYAVDLGYVALTGTQVQNEGDSADLSGAGYRR